MLDVASDLLLLIQLQSCLLFLIRLLCQSTSNYGLLIPLLNADWPDQRLEDGLGLRGDGDVVAGDFVFLEEVLDDVLSAVGVVEGSIALEKCLDLLFVKVGLCDLFLRQRLDSLEDLLVGHLKHYQLRWCQPRL